MSPENHAQSMTAAADRRPLTQVVGAVAITRSPEYEDDDQGPFLHPVDCDSISRAIRNRLWGQHQAFVFLHRAAVRLSRDAAPLIAAFREQQTSVTADQYDAALEAFAGLSHALNACVAPEDF